MKSIEYRHNVGIPSGQQVPDRRNRRSATGMMRSARWTLPVVALVGGCGRSSDPRAIAETASANQPSIAFPTQIELIGEFDIPYYFSEDDFESSHFGRDLVLLRKHHGDGPILALDPNSSTALWSVDALGATAVEHDGRVFVIRPERGASSTWAANFEIVEVAPRTGDELGSVKFDPAVPMFPKGRWVAHGERMIYIDGDAISAYDLLTGHQVWRTQSEADPLFAPAVAGSNLVTQGRTYLAYDLADGRERWRIDGECCTAIMSPNGAHVYVQGAGDFVLHVDANGSVLGQVTGRVEAASDANVVMVTQRELRVLTHEGRPLLTIPTEHGDDYFSAVALFDGWLSYWHAADDTLWLRDVSSDRRLAVRQAKKKLVVSTEVTGMAPALISAPPVIVYPDVYVLDWSLVRYRLDPQVPRPNGADAGS